MVKVFKHAVVTSHHVNAAVMLVRRTLLTCVTHAASSALLIVTTQSLCRQASAALGSTWLESQRGDVCGTSPDGTWPARHSFLLSASFLLSTYAGSKKLTMSYMFSRARLGCCL